MSKSLLPQGHKIRVLTTVENGETEQEIIGDDKLLCSFEEFVTEGHRLGLFISTEKLNERLKDVRGRLDDVIKLVNDPKFTKLMEGDDTFIFESIHEEIMEIEYHLKKIQPGE